MPTEITVTGCGDCPMYKELTASKIYCHMTEKRLDLLELLTDNLYKHLDCPLTKDSITIKLKSNETHKTDVRGGEQ